MLHWLCHQIIEAEVWSSIGLQHLDNVLCIPRNYLCPNLGTFRQILQSCVALPKLIYSIKRPKILLCQISNTKLFRLQFTLSSMVLFYQKSVWNFEVHLWHLAQYSYHSWSWLTIKFPWFLFSCACHSKIVYLPNPSSPLPFSKIFTLGSLHSLDS